MVLSTLCFLHHFWEVLFLDSVRLILTNRNPAFYPAFPGNPPWDFSLSQLLAELTAVFSFNIIMLCLVMCLWWLPRVTTHVVTTHVTLQI